MVLARFPVEGLEEVLSPEVPPGAEMFAARFAEVREDPTFGMSLADVCEEDLPLDRVALVAGAGSSSISCSGSALRFVLVRVADARVFLVVDRAFSLASCWFGSSPFPGAVEGARFLAPFLFVLLLVVVLAVDRPDRRVGATAVGFSAPSCSMKKSNALSW